MAKRKPRFKQMVEAIEADGPLEATVLASSSTDAAVPRRNYELPSEEGTDFYGDLSSVVLTAQSHESIWGFYEWERPLYRASYDKPRDSRWVLLRPGTK